MQKYTIEKKLASVFYLFYKIRFTENNFWSHVLVIYVHIFKNSNNF